MESKGLTGNIMVSEVSKKLIEMVKPNNYNFKFHTNVECKASDEKISGYIIFKNSNQEPSQRKEI